MTRDVPQVAGDEANGSSNGQNYLPTKSGSAMIFKCLQLLHDDHQSSEVPGRQVVRSVPIPQTSAASVTTAVDMSGPSIAHQFADGAAAILSSQEREELVRFLKHLRAGSKKSKEEVQHKVRARIERFYSEEVRVSGEQSDRLASPGGPADADVGVILHV